MFLPDKFFEKRIRVVAVLLLPALVLYFKSIFFDFTTMDEQWMIVKSDHLLHGIKALRTIFTNNIAGLYYRPLLMASFFVDYAIGRLSPHVYHFFNLALHLLSVLVVYRFFCLNRVKQQTAFVLALLFSVHPLMLHAVVWIPGRNDLLLCLFALSSINCLVRFCQTPKPRFIVGHLLFFIAALLTKENASVLPFIYAAFYLVYKKGPLRQLLYFALAWLLLVGVWLQARRYIVNLHVSPDFFSPATFKYALEAMLLYLGKALLPVQQSVLPMLKNSSLLPGLLAAALLVFFMFKPGIKNKRVALLGLLLFFGLLLLPVWFSVSGGVSEQYEQRVYTSMAGLFLFLSQLRFRVPAKALYYTALVVFCAFFIRTFSRMEVYRNGETFVNTGLKECPDFYLFLYHKGEQLFNKGEYDSALVYCNRAIAIRPDRCQLYGSRGVLHYYLANCHAAIADLTKAIALADSGNVDYHFYLNRCFAHLRCHETGPAMADLIVLKKRSPALIPGQFERDLVKKWSMDVEKLDRQISVNRGDAALYYRRAVLMLAAGMEENGVDDLAKACELAPANRGYQKLYMDHKEKAEQ